MMWPRNITVITDDEIEKMIGMNWPWHVVLQQIFQLFHLVFTTMGIMLHLGRCTPPSSPTSSACTLRCGGLRPVDRACGTWRSRTSSRCASSCTGCTVHRVGRLLRPGRVPLLRLLLHLSPSSSSRSSSMGTSSSSSRPSTCPRSRWCGQWPSPIRRRVARNGGRGRPPRAPRGSAFARWATCSPSTRASAAARFAAARSGRADDARHRQPRRRRAGADGDAPGADRSGTRWATPKLDGGAAALR